MQRQFVLKIKNHADFCAEYGLYEQRNGKQNDIGRMKKYLLNANIKKINMQTCVYRKTR